MNRPVLILLLLLVPATAVRAAGERSTAVAEVAFTYGVQALNHGDLDEAVRLFREAVAADPENREAREWLAFALRRQQAAAAGEAVAGAQVSLPSGFGGLLALRDQPRFDLRVGAAFGQDSNPAQLSDGVVATGPFGTLGGKVKDQVLNLDLRAAVYPFYGRGGWSLGLAAEAASASFQDLDFLDELQWRGAVQLAWGSDPLGYLTGPLGYTRVPFGDSRVSLLLQAGRGDVRQDGEPLVTADEAALSVVFRETRSTATQVELDFQSQDVRDGLVEPDVWSAGLSQLFFLGRRDRYVRLGVLRGEENGGLDGDSTALEGNAELALPLSDRWTLQLAASRRKEKFERGPSFDDTTTRAAAALSWQVAAHFYLTGRASWTERGSTRAPAGFSPLDFRDYQRTAASVGLLWIW